MTAEMATILLSGIAYYVHPSLKVDQPSEYRYKARHDG